MHSASPLVRSTQHPPHAPVCCFHHPPSPGRPASPPSPRCSDLTRHIPSLSLCPKQANGTPSPAPLLCGRRAPRSPPPPSQAFSAPARAGAARLSATGAAGPRRGGAVDPWPCLRSSTGGGGSERRGTVCRIPRLQFRFSLPHPDPRYWPSTIRSVFRAHPVVQHAGARRETRRPDSSPSTRWDGVDPRWSTVWRGKKTLISTGGHEELIGGHPFGSTSAASERGAQPHTRCTPSHLDERSAMQKSLQRKIPAIVAAGTIPRGWGVGSLCCRREPRMISRPACGRSGPGR